MAIAFRDFSPRTLKTIRVIALKEKIESRYLKEAIYRNTYK